MKRITKLTALAAATFAAISARASYVNGDLLVGFTSSGAANDYIFDVGQAASLTSGETWTLGTGVDGSFTSAQLASGAFGAIGSLNSTKTIYSTTDGTFAPNEAANSFNTIRANIQSVGSVSLTAGNGIAVGQTTANSWFTQTAQPSGTPGNYFFNNLDNPNASLTSNAYLFANDNNADPATPLGYFSVSADGNTLSYTAVPEPTSVSLLAGLGLAAFGLRRRMVCKA